METKIIIINNYLKKYRLPMMEKKSTIDIGNLKEKYSTKILNENRLPMMEKKISIIDIIKEKNLHKFNVNNYYLNKKIILLENKIIELNNMLLEIKEQI